MSRPSSSQAYSAPCKQASSLDESLLHSLLSAACSC
ncbi:rCG43894 [Rattus norvegicus]|uniref:RCG43894 n=1 Tax=Rattus norvegicus TaxID=10116 RepID=A6J794_RAT|nr:rCG43894 [Rattus norvegicus]